jgi:hypothetical protein
VKEEGWRAKLKWSREMGNLLRRHPNAVQSVTVPFCPIVEKRLQALRESMN